MGTDNWFKSLSGVEVDSFTLEEYVGSGKVAYVYRGRSKEVPDWIVALKLVPGSPQHGWQNEIKKASVLSGITGVVHFHGVGNGRVCLNERTEIFLYTVWDYIPPGRNLKDYLKAIHSCPTSFLLAVVERILRVLHACEKKGVKHHGDLHSGNILIGDKDEADLDLDLGTREPIFVSDFGFGATGQAKTPKDDYEGLARIVDEIIKKVEWDAGTNTDRQILDGIRRLINKLLREKTVAERRPPIEILRALNGLTKSIRGDGNPRPVITLGNDPPAVALSVRQGMSVGTFQVSEMLGDEWQWWKQLFVSAVPAKARILEPFTPTVVTGPRGCGKTMLFRRLSERLIVECGPAELTAGVADFVGLYVNANDIASAFPTFQRDESEERRERLVCYTNLCILSEILSVQSARTAKHGEEPSTELLSYLRQWFLINDQDERLVTGENPLDHFRSTLERIKWRFPKSEPGPLFPAFNDFCQIAWLPRLMSIARSICPWIGTKSVFIFLDDYTTPRISLAMQHNLNRLLFQRSSEFVCKVATESFTTFIPQDDTGKVLQDGDDYQLIDMGEESLFMNEGDRSWFLNEVFKRRLVLDPRIPSSGHTLDTLLGSLGIKKLEFARRLRTAVSNEETSINAPAPATHSSPSLRRGKTQPRVLYFGSEVFASLWSGDTRTMIQLIQELVDAASTLGNAQIAPPIDSELQDRVYRNRGGQWLESQIRNQPTDRVAYKQGLKELRKTESGFQFTGGSYGAHLKAVVEAFVKVARQLLLSPMYKMSNGREVPRMAFRIEVTDEFRVEGLAAEIYKDLIRYGMFMRDARGKSVRGAFVPRLYLRRLLLPYSTLALSKRDSVQMSCEWFNRLLLSPDSFGVEFTRYVSAKADKTQISLPFDDDVKEELPERKDEYEDIE